MPFIQGLLLSFIVMMQISITVSNPVGKTFYAHDRRSMRTMKLLLVDIENCTNIYDKDVLGHLDEQEVIVGITLPVKTEEINSSACAIREYLQYYLPPIIKEFLKDSDKFNKTIQEVKNQFIEVFPVLSNREDQTATSVLKLCNIEYKQPSHGYERKKMGYRILHDVQKWMRGFVEM